MHGPVRTVFIGGLTAATLGLSGVAIATDEQHATIYNHLNIQRHLIQRRYHGLFRMEAMVSWWHVTIPA